jgi:MFS family permease
LNPVHPRYPPGSFNAHWFNFFNAISFQIMMGAPIILYAKSLGASSTVIGIVASFTPLLTVLQLPAARFLDRCSYREFVLTGWGLRTLFIFLVAGVPVLTFLDPTARMALLLALLFLFNMLRGISSAAWLPWIAALIPGERRGRFLSLDQIFMVAGCLVSLGVSALVMGGTVDAWEYSLVFLVSAVGGALSLFFIKRIPEVDSAETVRMGSARVPWRAMLAYRPFVRLLGFNLLFMAVLGSLGVFTVEFLGEKAGFAPSYVLLLSACSFLGALVALPVCGVLVDRTGSKPVMRLATGVVTVVIAGWFVLAAGVLPALFWIVACLNLFAGAASATHNLANTRIIMATMPEMGRNHFFALFTVITSLGLGTAPVAWGLLLDVIGTYEAVTGPVIWRQHSFYFLALFVIGVLSCLAVSWLVEAPSGQKPEPNLIYAKLKREPRIWQR